LVVQTTLGSYLTQRWGNPKAEVSIEQVGSLRSGGAGSSLVTVARLAMLAAVALAIAIVVAILKRRRPPRANRFR
jgi:hypothetical protein